MGKNSIATRLAQSLSFEVEASPQENVIEFKNAKNITPVNVKIRVRKREDGPYVRNGYLSVPNADEPDTAPQRIRIASSDHTIMSFNIVMEADRLSPDRKAKRKFFGIPGLCLGTQEDDDGSQYMPSTTKGLGSSSDTRIFTNKSPLSKNADILSNSSSKKYKKLFGKCKPGGCLDPPLDEDKYVYSPILIPDTKSLETEAQRLTKDSDSKYQKESKKNDSFLHGKENKPNDRRKENTRKSSNDSYIDKKRKKKRESNDTVATSDSIITYPPTPSDHDMYNDNNIRRNSSRKQDECRDKYYTPIKTSSGKDKNRVSDDYDRKYSETSPGRKNKSPTRRVSENSENKFDSKSTPTLKKLRSRKVSSSIFSEIDKDIAADNSEDIDKCNNLSTNLKSGDLSTTKKEITMIDIPAEKRKVVNRDVISSAETDTRDSSPTKKIISTDKNYIGKDVAKDKRNRETSPTKNKIYLNKDDGQDRYSRDTSPTKKKIKLANISAEQYEDVGDVTLPTEKGSRDSSPTKNKLHIENSTELDKDLRREKHPRDLSPTKKNIILTDIPLQTSKNIDNGIIPSKTASRDSSPTRNKLHIENNADLAEDVTREKQSRDSSPTKRNIIRTDIPIQKSENVDNGMHLSEKRSHNSFPTKNKLSTKKYEDLDEDNTRQKHSRDSSPTKRNIIPTDIPRHKSEDINKVLIPPEKTSRDSYPTKRKLHSENNIDLDKDVKPEKHSRVSSPTKRNIIHTDIPIQKSRADNNCISPSEREYLDSFPAKNKLPSENFEDLDKYFTRQKHSCDSSPTKRNVIPTDVPRQKSDDIGKLLIPPEKTSHDSFRIKNKLHSESNADLDKDVKREKHSRDSSPTKRKLYSENNANLDKDVVREKHSRDLSPIKRNIIRTDMPIQKSRDDNNYISPSEKESLESSPTKNKLPTEKFEVLDKYFTREKYSRDSSPTKGNIIPKDIPRQRSEDVGKVLILPEKTSRDSSPPKNKLHSESNADLAKREKYSRDSSPTKRNIVPTDIPRQQREDVSEVLIPPEKTSRDSSPPKKKLHSESIADLVKNTKREKHSRDSSPTKRNIILTDIPLQKSENIDNGIIPLKKTSRDSSPNKNKLHIGNNAVLDEDVTREKRSRDSSPTKNKLLTENFEGLDKYITREKHSRDASPTKRELILKEKHEDADNEFITPSRNEKIKPTDIPDYRDYITRDDTYTEKNESNEYSTIHPTEKSRLTKINKLKSEDIPGLIDNYIKDLSKDTLAIESAVTEQKQPTDIETVYLSPHTTQDAHSEKSEGTPKVEQENSDEYILFQISNEANIVSKPEAILEINNKKGYSTPATKGDQILNNYQDTIARKEIGLKEEIANVAEDNYDYDENVSFIQDSSDAQQDTSYIQDSSDAQQDRLSNKSERSEDTAKAFNIEDLEIDGLDEEKERKSHYENDKPLEDVRILQKDNTFQDENENIRYNDAVLIGNAENIYKPRLKDQTFAKNIISEDEDIKKEDKDDNQYQKYTEKDIEIVKDRDISPTRDERKSLTISPVIEIAISPTGQVIKEVNEKLLESINGSQHKNNVTPIPFDSSKHDDIGVIDNTWNKKPTSEDEISSKRKDSIFLNLAFQTYFDENQLVVKTIDSSVDTDTQNVTLVKSLVRSSNKSISVPIDPDHAMIIEIKPSNQSDRKSKIPKPISKHDTGKSVSISGGSLKDISSNLKLLLTSIHDQDLAPLQEIIKELKKDIDQLADQQIKFREKLGPGPKRLQPQVHTIKTPNTNRCPCLKRY